MRIKLFKEDVHKLKIHVVFNKCDRFSIVQFIVLTNLTVDTNKTGYTNAFERILQVSAYSTVLTKATLTLIDIYNINQRNKRKSLVCSLRSRLSPVKR